VFKQLEKLDQNKCTGLGGLPSRLLKIAAPVIAHPITNIFNHSLITGEYPQDFKIAKVSALYKAGCKTEPSNYRPIAILPVLSKILERAVHHQLYTFLQNFWTFKKPSIVLTMQFSCQN